MKNKNRTISAVVLAVLVCFAVSPRSAHRKGDGKHFQVIQSAPLLSSP